MFYFANPVRNKWHRLAVILLLAGWISSGVKVVLAQGIVPCGPADCNSWGKFSDLISSILAFFIRVSIPLATLVIIYGGVVLLTSGGSQDRIKRGKDAILAAAVGLAIVFGSYIIYNAVIKAISNP